MELNLVGLNKYYSYPSSFIHYIKHSKKKDDFLEMWPAWCFLSELIHLWFTFPEPRRHVSLYDCVPLGLCGLWHRRGLSEKLSAHQARAVRLSVCLPHCSRQSPGATRAHTLHPTGPQHAAADGAITHHTKHVEQRFTDVWQENVDWIYFKVKFSIINDNNLFKYVFARVLLFINIS